MADWIRVSRGIKTDPKVVEFAAALRIAPEAAIGLLIQLWLELPDHARDGQIDHIADPILEAWAAWRGRRGIFAAQLRRLFQTPDGRLNAWDRHNGKALEQADKDKERVRQWREKNANRTHNETPTEPVRKRVRNAKRTVDVTGDVRTDVRTDELLTTTTNLPSGGWPARLHEAFKPIGLFAPPMIGSLLKAAVHEYGEEWIVKAAECYVRRQGDGDKPQFLGPQSFAKRAGYWVNEVKPVELYGADGDRSPDVRALERA